MDERDEGTRRKKYKDINDTSERYILFNDVVRRPRSRRAGESDNSLSPLSGEPRALRAHSLVLFPSRPRGGSPAPGRPSPTPGVEIRNLRFVIPRLGFHLGRAQDVSKLEKRRNGKEDERKDEHEDVHLVVWV